MSRAPAVWVQIKNATGAPVSGGKLHTYITDTTTNKTTWSDAAKSVPNDNPIEAGADGICGPIYMTDNEAYTFVEKDASDVTLRTQNGIFSGMLTSSSLLVHIQRAASSPTSYGAVGDGVADESSEVQSAIDNATGVVDLLGLTFRCDSTINLASGITLQDGTLDFSNCTDDEFILAEGTIGAENLLTSHGDVGDTTIAVTSASGLASGDLLHLYSDHVFTHKANAKAGEIVEIASISGTTLTLVEPLRDDYRTTNNGAVKEITSVDDVTCKDLIIECASPAGTHSVMAFINCHRVRVSNVTMKNHKNYGIEIAGSKDVIVDGCRLQDVTDISAYGIYIHDACRNVRVTNCTLSGQKYGIYIPDDTVGNGAAVGPVRDVYIERSRITSSIGVGVGKYMVHVGHYAQDVVIRDNFIKIDSAARVYGIWAACSNIVVESNDIVVRGGASSYGINVGAYIPAPDNSAQLDQSIKILGNRISTDQGGIYCEPDATTGEVNTLHLLEISNNVIPEAGGAQDITVDVAPGAADSEILLTRINNNTLDGKIDISATVVTGNYGSVEVKNCKCEQIIVAGESSKTSIAHLQIYGCSLRADLAVKAVDISDILDAMIIGNSIWVGPDAVNDYTVGIEASDCTSCQIRQNLVFLGPGASGNSIVTTDSHGAILCSGNYCYSALNIASDTTAIGTVMVTDNASLSGITVNLTGTGAENAIIANNRVTAITLSGYCDGFTISGNRLDATGTALTLTGSAASALQEGSIVGNSIKASSTAISATNVSEVFSTGNTLDAPTKWSGISNDSLSATNWSDDNNIECDTVGVAELANYVASLVLELQKHGILGGSVI
jgi:parallel beta-helix repeat protein